MVKELFRDKELTEFIIATIPTVLGINESRRLLQALRKEEIPCRRIIINQVCCRTPLFPFNVKQNTYESVNDLSTS